MVPLQNSKTPTCSNASRGLFDYIWNGKQLCQEVDVATIEVWKTTVVVVTNNHKASHFDKVDFTRSPGLHDCRSGLQLMRLINVCYETSMALVTFSFGSVFGMVMVRMPSSTLAEIWSFTTSSGST